MSEDTPAKVEVVNKPWGSSHQLDGQQIARIIKKRREFIEDEGYSLEENSLVGSWFLVIFHQEIIWQGAVVAQLGPERYLCDIDRLEQGAERVQRVFTLDAMMGLDVRQVDDDEEPDSLRNIEGTNGGITASVLRPGMEWRFFDSQESALRAFQQHTVMRARRAREEEEA
jgi:hypothetical protein